MHVKQRHDGRERRCVKAMGGGICTNWMVHRRGWTYLYLCWVIRWKNTTKLVQKLLYFCLWIDNHIERHRSSDKGWSPHSPQYCCCPQEASTGSPPFHRENTSSLWASAQIVETKKPAVTISKSTMTINAYFLCTLDSEWKCKVTQHKEHTSLLVVPPSEELPQTFRRVQVWLGFSCRDYYYKTRSTKVSKRPQCARPVSMQLFQGRTANYTCVPWH